MTTTVTAMPASIATAMRIETEGPCGGEAAGAAGGAGTPSGAGGPATTTPLTPGQALMLQAWLSPAFPVGAFAYSHGLEWAVEDGTVTSLATLAAWLDGVLRHGAGRSDAILLAHAHRALAAGDLDAFAEAAELAAALQPTGERRLEAIAQGEAFLKAVRATWPHPEVDANARLLEARAIPATYPIATASAAAAHGLSLGATIAAYLQAFAANLASAAVRLVPLGQTDGQRAVAGAHATVLAVAGEAEQAHLDDIGGAALRADIASARHETQYTRLFRS
jgi:urease accessory protein